MKKFLITVLIVAGWSSTTWCQVQNRFEEKSGEKDSVETKIAEDLTGNTDTTFKNEPQASQQKENIWDKLVFGGNASFNFGGYTFIYLGPSVGYKLTENTVAGTGFIYQFFKINQVYDPSTGNYVKVTDYGDQIYGPKFFVTQRLFERFYGGAQLEVLNYDHYTFNPATNDVSSVNMWGPVLWLEAGLTQPLGKKGFVQLGLRYNILHDETSPYASPWFPVIGIFF